MIAWIAFLFHMLHLFGILIFMIFDPDGPAVACEVKGDWQVDSLTDCILDGAEEEDIVDVGAKNTHIL